ncbi:MAG: sigma 54-interacting transcriptional regulator [Alphaproteobacteria bacterium]|nr:sigma 54-interacting transcriptional regulator [Alphaproteobacteria bacterium]
MRLDVEGEDRPGITAALLGAVAAAGYDVSFVEVERGHVYLSAPDLTPAALPGVRARLETVPGFHRVSAIDRMPRERRRIELEAALNALPDPVFVTDSVGLVRRANRAAARAADRDLGQLVGRSVAGLAGLPDLAALQAASAAGAGEVSFAGRRYLPELASLRSPDDEEIDGYLVQLKPAARLGQMMAATRGAPAGVGLDAIIGESAVIRALRQRIQRLGAVEAPVLILGETGAGKELIAHALHHESQRADKPLLALNCAAIPENLAESELFGYEAGAFSGAARGGKPGLVELAEGGAILLDEVGELTPYLQAKLLRFLQDGRFRRIGGGPERRSAVRILAATNRDLSAMVARGVFREDLLYRLNVLTVEAPPLRARPEDVPILADRFVRRAADQIGRPVPRLSPAAYAALAAHPWPGNVRELENRLFRAISLLDDDRLEPGDIDLEPPPPSGGTALPGEAEPETLAEAAARGEAALLRRLAPDYPTTRALAARLGVSHTTIAQKLRRYGLAPTRRPGSE